MDYINFNKHFRAAWIFTFHIILLLTLMPVNCWGYGFDATTSCSPNAKQSRKGRAKILNAIPCDLTNEPYCILPGSAYPWNAVRRFVHENGALMKRMYGDVRHIAILKNEILNNHIDVNDIEMASERYSRDGYRRSSKLIQQQQQQQQEEQHANNDDNDHNDHNYDAVDNIKSNNVVEKVNLQREQETVVTTTTSSSTTTTTALPLTTTTKTTFLGQNTETEENASSSSALFSINETPLLSNLETVTEQVEKSTINTILKENQTVTNALTLLNINNNNNSDTTTTTITTIIINKQSKDNTVHDSSVPTLIGDNIEIVESPKLASLNNVTAHNDSAVLEKNTIVTHTTTFKAASSSNTLNTIPIKTITERSTPLPFKQQQQQQQRKPFTPSISQRFRPQSQNLYKLNSTISAKLKLKVNLTEFTTMASISVNNNNNNNNNSNNTNSTIKLNTSALKAAPVKYNKLNYNRLENQHKYGTSTSNSSPSGSSLSGNANAELLLGEKLRKPIISNVTPGPLPGPAKPLLHEGELFQDSVKQDAPSIMKGVNACPVKEEVVAPFWANNTRGEILALLNLYPFEQYVHMEKCIHEHKRMYCREGCRCEQQYRLHRLLAYDPMNECRGIFSDWFRFPACCGCKCYNVPFDFRTTSRSPRSVENAEVEGEEGRDIHEAKKHLLDLAEERVKHAIYQHATEDWYRPTDEVHFLDV